MKIAFIGQKGIPAQQGGVEKHVEELATRLAKADFDVSVYNRPHYTTNKKIKYRGVNIINLPSLNTKHLDAISHTFFASVHALFQNYDIIHYHSVGPSLMSWIPRLLAPRSKVIVTFHCIDRQHQKWGFIARLALAIGEWTACYFPHQTITVSETLKKYCKYRFDKEVIYIPNGVSTKKTEGSDILKKFGLQKKQYIIAVSRLVQHKGLHTLIRAYQLSSLNQKLVIVGSSAKTNDYVDKLQKMSAGNENIIFTGEQTGENLVALFQNASLFIQPSEAEGLSIALLEAMSYGIPVISSDIEENLEVIQENGLSFRNKNVIDLAAKLNFAENHPKFMTKKARQAKKIADEKYNWDEIVLQIANLYKSMSEKPKTSLALSR